MHFFNIDQEVMELEEQIRLLVNLQKTDLSIDKLEGTINDIPKKIEEWGREFKKKEADLETMKQGLETLTRDLRSKERKLISTNEDLKRYGEKIYKVKTQKEMVALDHEIDLTRKEKDRLENRIIELMEETENLSLEIEKRERELNAEKERLAMREKEYQEKLSKNKKELDLLLTEKNGIVSKVRKDLLALYEKLRKNKNNLAIVPIKNEACQGCFMTIPPQVINEVKMNEKLIRCENCVRILYWEKE
ncbi:MAG: C4-type zinc ribbon domain-containing protein [bacterium]|nr:C4-type zinc ribbon domain-containing protein [bacterium]